MEVIPFRSLLRYFHNDNESCCLFISEPDLAGYCYNEGMIDQPNNPLHGTTLEMILIHLVEHLGWDEMGKTVPIRCFTHDPSIKSSLTFLRRTPWARKKVEALYLRHVSRLAGENNSQRSQR